MPRLLVPIATVSPRLIGWPHAASVARVVVGMSVTRGRGKLWRTRTIHGSAIAVIYAGAMGKSSVKCPFPLDFCPSRPVYVGAIFHGPTPLSRSDALPDGAPSPPGRLRMVEAPPRGDPSGGRVVSARREGAEPERVRRCPRPVQGDRHAAP